VIRRTVRIQLVAFLLITVLGIGYAGFQYVGLGNKIFNKPFTVTAEFENSGGIYPNAEVTLRGVQVGQVKSLDLSSDKSHLEVKLSIRDHWKNRIPKEGIKAVVANLSAVGEQYLDLQPTSDTGPTLREGDVITGGTIPIPNDQLLLNLDRLVNSLDRKQLASVITLLDQAFSGTGPDLARLIARGDSLTKAATDALPQTIKLINDGKIVLDTQRDVASNLASFARDLNTLSASIHADDPAYRRLIDNGVKSAQQLDGLLQENEGPLFTLLSNLVTVSAIQAAPVRLDGLRTILTIYPSTVYNGFRAAPGDNKAHFGIVSPADQNPKNCDTQAPTRTAPGYLFPKFIRDGENTAGQDPKAKLNADCLLPHNSDQTVRGARNAPRPPGDTTGNPSSFYPGFGPVSNTNSAFSSSSSGTAKPSAGAPATPFARASASYDPVTALLTAPNGQVFTVGSNGGQATYFGSDAWKWLLIAPTVG
jgi:phospholipid/cholesterol/gamma-HCH transport system substrate-binding protein